MDEILDFNVLKPYLPEEASRVANWLETIYVCSRIRHFLLYGDGSARIVSVSLWSAY